MSGDNNIEVRVENLLVRFTPTPPVDLEEAVERLGGVVNGDVLNNGCISFCDWN